MVTENEKKLKKNVFVLNFNVLIHHNQVTSQWWIALKAGHLVIKIRCRTCNNMSTTVINNKIYGFYQFVEIIQNGLILMFHLLVMDIFSNKASVKLFFDLEVLLNSYTIFYMYFLAQTLIKALNRQFSALIAVPPILFEYSTETT